MVREMDKFNYVTDAAEIKKLVKPVAFEPNKDVEIRTEKYNISPVMSPGELDALVDNLIRDFEDNPANDATLINDYKTMLIDFAKDWREIWHLHGYQKEGWPKYQQAIDCVVKQLHPDRRALVTHSNSIGVNPIVVQRILSSALAVDKLDQFLGQADRGS